MGASELPVLRGALGPRETGEEVERLLAGIDLASPLVDEQWVVEELQQYVRALGLPAPRVRFAPEVRALRDSRILRGDRGDWRAFMGRQGWLLDPRWPDARSRAWDATREAGSLLARSDRAVVAEGLGRSRYVAGVRDVTPSLARRALELRPGGPANTPKRLEALLPLARAAAAGLFALAVGGGDDLVALLRPRLRIDEEGRLHDWSGLPAAEWPYGRGLYFWRGVAMTESAGRDPDAVTPSRIAGWANAERRRVAIERIGLERFLHGLGARAVQQDDYGTLWRTEREVGGEPYVAVEVVNATEEPGGTRRRYFLRVPPSVRSARRAVAWTFGLTRADEYAPVAQS